MKQYCQEGTLNKFLIDDKGMLFLLAYGLPPLVHTDDATRAVLSCFDIAAWLYIHYFGSSQFDFSSNHIRSSICI